MKTALPCLAAVLCSIATIKTPLQAAEPEIYFAPNVVDQFNALALRPEPLGFALFNSPNPSLCRHYQGMARKNGPGTPYLFVTRSGNDPGLTAPCAPSDVDGPANLLVVRMGSRDANGERLRSNRLLRDSDISFFHPNSGNGFSTMPDRNDTVVTWLSFDGQNGWPAYQHAGGVQLVGDVLAVPLDTRLDGSLPEFLIQFIDVSNPEAPAPLSQWAPVDENGSPANTSVVGLTPVRNPDGPGLRYLMIATGGKNTTVTFWRSLPTEADNSSDLKNLNLQWERLASYSESQIESCLGGNDWPTGLQDPYQTLNFVRQGSLSGSLFLIGAQNTLVLDEDLLDLYQVHIDEFGNPDPQCPLTFQSGLHVTSSPIMGGGDSANFAAASGVYISPSGELIIYGAEYENDGPFFIETDGSVHRRTVRFAEWRHRKMVRGDSETLKPSIEIAGSFVVDEGSAVSLAAQARGPITKAWIQLFEDEGLGLSLPGLVDSDRWLVIDYNDWDNDNFDDFNKLHFNDEADSIRWFAPLGCTLRLNQHSFNDSDFPGGASLVLPGEGAVFERGELDSVPGGNGDTIGDTISSVEFCGDCDDYYNAPISVAWDLDFDGAFESSGTIVSFSAVELDGPSGENVLVRAQHPTDTTPLGQSFPKSTRIQVRNVPPTIHSFELVDSLGNPAPFALLHLPYSALGTFTDPGKPDRQTATLDWDDGTIEPSSAFDQFSDAFGGVTGQFQHSHSFSSSGLFALALAVTDDDAGQDSAQFSVQVLTPLEALQVVVDQINALLTSAPNAQAAAALRDARDNVLGNNNGAASNGAMDKLEKGNLVAALIKISAAIDSLNKAEAKGAGDLDALKYLLGLIAESIAQTEYLRAQATLPSPTPSQAARLARVQQAITNGHTLLAGGDYLGALREYKDAVSRAAGL